MSPSLAVFSMHKNEGALSINWSDYYSAITSTDSIYIIDNGSTGASLEVMRGLINRGINVRSLAGKEYFENKGNILLEWAREVQPSCKHDFIYFADADEFLFSRLHNNINSSKNAIWGELNRISESNNLLFRIKDGLVNIPDSTDATPDHFGSQKVMLKSAALGMQDLSIDLGFHLYDWGSKTDLKTYGYIEHSNFGYVHLHNKPYSMFKEHAIEKLSGRVDTNNIQDLKNYKGAGMHLIDRLLMTKDEYEESFIKNQGKPTDISCLFKEHGLKYPMYT